jgi:hypothetical protein
VNNKFQYSELKTGEAKSDSDLERVRKRRTNRIFLKLKFFMFKIIFFMFWNRFDVLMSKIIF